MLTIIAEINTVSETSVQHVINALKQVKPMVLTESGCHGYDLYIDSYTESALQTKMPNSIVMIEKWESLQHLETHMHTSHMQAYQRAVQAHVADVKIRILKHDA